MCSCVFSFLSFSFWSFHPRVSGTEKAIRLAADQLCVWCDVILNVGYVNEKSSPFTQGNLCYTPVQMYRLAGKIDCTKNIYYIYIKIKKYIYINRIYVGIYLSLFFCRCTAFFSALACTSYPPPLSPSEAAPPAAFSSFLFFRARFSAPAEVYFSRVTDE